MDSAAVNFGKIATAICCGTVVAMFDQFAAFYFAHSSQVLLYYSSMLKAQVLSAAGQSEKSIPIPYHNTAVVVPCRTRLDSSSREATLECRVPYC
jgi:hypothetical protein